MRTFRKGTGPIEFIQLYGERNSGTTYLSRLLQDNMRIPTNFLGMAKSKKTPLGIDVFGYKHWFIKWEKLADPRQRKTLFVVIYRNPYTWIRAMMDRPYALSRSLTDRTVEDLPSVKLAGHVNDKDTPYEFDPDTGEQQTIFDLRKKKIEHFEALKSKVDNVVYVNLEELLEDTSSVIHGLASEFSTAFNSPLSLDRPPFKQLTNEYRSPETFDEREIETLNRAIDWSTEDAIGYSKVCYSLSMSQKTIFIILHGGSAVGKSHIMTRIVERGEDLFDLEMDDCQYWNDYEPKFDLATLRLLVPGATEHDFAELLKVIEKASDKGKRCIEHLLLKLRELGVREPHQQTGPRVIIATCGSLPDPKPSDSPSVYSWLTERLPITFHHLLIDIPIDIHERRIEKRGRSHLREAILEYHNKKIKSRNDYHAVVSDYRDSVDAVSSLIGQERLPRTDRSTPPRKPRLRVQRNGLTYIQIYGERNSGTKYLKSLISENARHPENVIGSYATKNNPINTAKLIGYKHYYPRLENLAKHQDKTLFLVIYKNPYTWIRSMLAKPYHFKGCLEGKTIIDLPELQLAGFDIHGREIPDVHPETGERITMFGLRKHKILAWENLVNLANNVVYVNYEDLLLSPTEIVQRITDEFGSLFTDPKVREHVPDQSYVGKYRQPKPFRDAELAVMNANIDWSAEAIAGYQMNNFFVPDYAE